ncbi:MAG TPA: energy transducer TonB [Bryobacteraceae bacterium]|jgi:protein TonB|nr:energy transducer TonB [Bryobacteraceae bacterium]
MRKAKYLIGAGLIAFGLVQIATAQNDEKVYRIGEEGVTPPTVLSKTEPVYTDEARDAKIEGAVVLSLEIDTEGFAQNIEVTRSLNGGLDQSAMTAVQQWRFKPSEKNGKPVRVVAKIEVNFRLK